jgi:hypothetical protein
MVDVSRPVPRSYVLFAAAAFAVAYAQYALFYHTQNQYFFQGLAKAGYGLLRADWFAQTPDPWPVFSGLVEFTQRYLSLRLVYLYFLVLAGVYAFSMIGIISQLVPIHRTRATFLIFVTLMVALHSPVFGYLVRMGLRLPLTSSPHHFNIGRILLLEGIGEKRILGDMLNPGTFGAFLLLSIYLFMRGRPVWAITTSTIASIFQPSYVLCSAVLTLTYMAIMIRRGKGVRPAIGLGLLAFVLILPVLAYSYLAFGPTNPALWKEAQNILWRVAYYPPSVPSLWLGGAVYIKVALIVAALYLVRKTDFFWILLGSFLTTAVLTAAQAVRYNNTLAALLPWRMSAFTVPLATLIILGYAVSLVVSRLETGAAAGQALVVASVGVLVLFCIAGVLETRARFALDARRIPTVMRHVKRTGVPGQTYLIPPNWRTFRLYTGAPAFMEHSVIPYDDVGVMEWYKRLHLAQAFYGEVEANAEDDFRYQREGRRTGRAPRQAPAPTPVQPSPEERCRLLKELSSGYGVTHVILRGGGLEGCAGWKTEYADEHYHLYALAK